MTNDPSMASRQMSTCVISVRCRGTVREDSYKSNQGRHDTEIFFRLATTFFFRVFRDYLCRLTLIFCQIERETRDFLCSKNLLLYLFFIHFHHDLSNSSPPPSFHLVLVLTAATISCYKTCFLCHACCRNGE